MNKPILKINGIKEIKEIKDENNEKMDRLPEEILFYYLIDKNINIITDNIYTINRKKSHSGPINNSVLLHRIGGKK